MSRFTDRNYLTQEQYKDASNLDVRLNIHKRFSTNPYGWFQWLFDELQSLPADAKVLEIGCGTGELWKECAARIPEGWTLTLADLSDGMLDAAWRNLIVIKRGIKFEKVDAQSIPYADGAFDAVIANHMLYHVPDRTLAFSEMRRVLKDGGTVFASTVGANHMRQVWDWTSRATDGRQGMPALSFTLESGREQLQEFFPRVELKEYPDSLQVTDVSMLKEYIRLMTSTVDLQEEQLQLVDNELDMMIKKNGEIYIKKETGLFIASK